MELTCDVECYRNYFLVTVYSIKHRTARYFEMFNDHCDDLTLLRRLLKNHTIITFNGNNYDIPLIYMFLDGCTNEKLKETSDNIINGVSKPWSIIKSYKSFNIDHIDIFDVAPGKATLKIYGGRLQTGTIQDLPLEPSSIIDESQLQLMRKYCANDTKITAELYSELSYQIGLRKQMGDELGTDLRSKGDSNIAETIILNKLKELNVDIDAQPYVPDTWHYTAPEFIRFETAQCRQLLTEYESQEFTLDNSGHVVFKFSDGKPQRQITIGLTTYTAALGGIHSCEESVCYTAENDHIIEDCDVTSYYPSTILNNNIYPEHLGIDFIRVYGGIVADRIKAKQNHDKDKAQALKIPINATFGKLSSKYSKLYSPYCSPRVTITGQLSLLMLIEQLEKNGISVISANTDGIVTYFHKSKKSLKDSIVADWCRVTRYDMEITPYRLIASRDVNNYVAIKTDNHVKAKGSYADLTDPYNRLRLNPRTPICYTAVRNYLYDGTPIEQTVKRCTDIRQFLTVAQVNGGAVYDGLKFGKSIRYYYSIYSLDWFERASGGKVPMTDESQPCMTLPDKLPADIDYQIYIDLAERYLTELGI